MVMLNTDLHSPQIEKKMTKEQFISNNRGIGPGGADVPRAVLEAVYDSISDEEIKIEQAPDLARPRPTSPDLA